MLDDDTIPLAAPHSIAHWLARLPDYPNCIYQPWRDGFMGRIQARPNSPTSQALFDEGAAAMEQQLCSP